MNNQKVDVLFFDTNALTIGETEKRVRGYLYLEKRPSGKFLCFCRGDDITAIKLTKKMYKNLNRFTSGVRMERCYDPETEWEEECNNDEDLDENDVYYIMDRRFPRQRGWQSNLPATVPTVPKAKAPFIVEMFRYKEKSNGSI